MRDRLTKERRSWNMSRIRGKNTSPEIVVRKLLHRMGYRFRLHVRIPIAPEGVREIREWTRNAVNRRQQRKERAGGNFSLPSRPLRSSVQTLSNNRPRPSSSKSPLRASVVNSTLPAPRSALRVPRSENSTLPVPRSALRVPRSENSPLPAPHSAFRAPRSENSPLSVRHSAFRAPRSENSTLPAPRSALRVPRSVCPDIVLPKYKTVIFVHGCFWHRHRGCKNCTTPTNRRKWWLAKLNGNAARDALHRKALQKLGWRSIVIWECATEKSKSAEGLGIRLAKVLMRKNGR